MNEEKPLIHTLTTDIQDELRKKDANMLASAINNVGVGQKVATPAPNYMAIAITGVVVTLMIAGAYYIFNMTNVVVSQPIDNNNDLTGLATSSVSNMDVYARVNSPAIIIPKLNDVLSAYTKLKDFKEDYIIYKIDDYNGLVYLLLNNEDVIKRDLSKFFNKENAFDRFVDISYMNQDLRLASSTLYSISTTTALAPAATNTPSGTMTIIEVKTQSTSTLIYGIYNREYLIFSTSRDNWMKGFDAIIR